MQPNHKVSTSHFLTDRRYDIDAIRVFAFGILILYHVGMFYVQDWGWHIKSVYQVTWLQEPMMFFNQWRMALLFVISGMATAILIHKMKRGFLGSRMKKLGLPLLFGMFVIVVPQAYFEAKANGLYNESYLSYWLAYVTFSHTDIDITWNHLWYLPYIMFYTLVTVSVRAIVKQMFPQASVKIESEKIWYWFAVMLVVLMLCGTFIFPLFPFRSHALVDDWYTHSLFFTFFVFGYFLIRSSAIWQSLKVHRNTLLALAVVAFIAMKLMNNIVTEDSGFLLSTTQLFFLYLNRVGWIVVILAFGYTFLNRPSNTIQYANSAVFSWYILHQSITIIIGAWVSPLALGGAVESSLVLGGTIIGCLVIHHFIVRPLPILHPFFGVSAPGKSDSAKQMPELPEISAKV